MNHTRTARLRSWLVLGVALAGLLVACAGKSADATRYHCPMHPTYVSDRPGDCPICGMRLVPIEEATHAAAVASSSRDDGAASAARAEAASPASKGWICPMHCEGSESDKPGKCPTCGMSLVPNPTVAPPAPGAGPSAVVNPPRERKLLYYRSPMDPKVTSPGPAKDSMGMDFVPVYSDEIPAAGAAATPAGLAAVSVGDEGMRLAGVQTAVASRDRLQRTVRTVGTVTADETRIRHVHTKIAGWVDKLYVDFTGQVVAKGQPLLAIYSPELLASQEEYLRAREASTRFASSSLPEVKKGGEELVTAARRRLELWDVPPGFLTTLARTGKPQRAVPVLAIASGVVTAKGVYEGQQVDPSMELFTLTDLSHVWIEAAVYESEAASVHVGQEATLTLADDPTVRIKGAVTYVNPTVSSDTRTLKVRFELDNPDLKLRPGQYANIELVVESGEGVVVPDSAILDTGLRKIVFVRTGEGRFVPREVEVALRTRGQAQVSKGLAEGDQVAVKANFLLDSESRLRAALEPAAGAAATPSAGLPAEGQPAAAPSPEASHVH